MPIYRQRNGKDEWIIRTAPQCMTDVLVQVAREKDPGTTLFTFEIGELIREELEGDGTLNGEFVATPARRAELARWADLLEIHARTIRAVLAMPELPPVSERLPPDEAA